MDNLKKLKIVFVSHESSLSGAPILLLNLITLLKENGFNFSIVLKRGGEIEDKFFELGRTFILKPRKYQSSEFLVSKVIDYIYYRIRLLRIIKEIRGADIVFNNTITNGRFLGQIVSLKKPILTYVHELESVIQYYDKYGDSSLSLNLSSAFFSPNDFVSRNLQNHNIPNERIFPLNYYFPIPDESLYRLKSQRQKEFFNKFNIPDNKFYVVGMGTATLRKGIDFFVEACSLVNQIDGNVHFVWIGDFINEDERKGISEAMMKLNVTSSSFTLTGFVSNNALNLLPFDILLLTSREDPYPLVVLEAALLKIPTIAFKGSGGMDHFIHDDAGFLLEGKSAKILAERILWLKENPSEIADKGINAFQKVKKLHTSPSLIFSQLETAISSVVNTDSMNLIR